MSDPQIPIAETRTCSSPGPGSVRGRSTSSKWRNSGEFCNLHYDTPGTTDKTAQFVGEGRNRDHEIAAVDGVFAREIERYRAGFLGDDFQRREIPRLGLGFDPGIGFAAGDQHGVQAAAHAAHGPKRGENSSRFLANGKRCMKLSPFTHSNASEGFCTLC